MRGRRRRPLLDRAVIDAAKERFNISDIASRWVAKPLERAGHEKKGLCLFHAERTPSMRLNDQQGTFHCFGCGAGGDLVRFVMLYLKIDFPAAMAWLGAAELPPVDPAERARLLAAETADRLFNIQASRDFFAHAEKVEGSAAETYLRARGLEPPYPGTLRFGYIPSWRHPEEGWWGRRRPCLVGGFQNVDGRFCGIQRIFWPNDDPRLGKAECKLSLGEVKGCALRLGPPAEEVVPTEGPEDGLSILKESIERSVWVAAGTGLLPFMLFPPVVRSVLIAGQNNEPGRLAVRRAGEAYWDRGELPSRAVFPPPEFEDWNDLIMGREIELAA